MCFSASTSFILSGALGIIGLLSVRKIENKSQLYFASIPYFFAIQQFAEGILWLILTNKIGSELKYFSMYLFLFFAFVFWPVYMPWAIIKMEPKKSRKLPLYLTLLVGTFNFIYGAYCLLYYRALAKAAQGHIEYNVYVPKDFMYFVAYMIAVILPFFITSLNYMWMFGTLLAASLLVTLFVYIYYFTSVWCFFGAVISLGVYWIIVKNNKVNSSSKA